MSTGGLETAADRTLAGLIKDNQQTASKLNRRQKAVPLRGATSWLALVPYQSTLGGFCAKSHQFIAGMMVACVSLPAAAVAARPALVR